MEHRSQNAFLAGRAEAGPYLIAQRYGDQEKTSGPAWDTAKSRAIVVIESRRLIRECLLQSLANLEKEFSVLAFANVAEWLDKKGDAQSSLIALFGSGRTTAGVAADMAALLEADPSCSVVLVSDEEDLVHTLESLAQGARGFIPTSLSLNAALEAIHFVRAGGTFVPASCLLAARNPPQRNNHHVEPQATADQETLTSRQHAVINALRKGKPNKVIAYELNMRESTVKVHVRNIMRKLNARNRTEVAVHARFGDGLADGS